MIASIQRVRNVACGLVVGFPLLASAQPASQPAAPLAATEAEFTAQLRSAAPGDVIQTPFSDFSAIPTLQRSISVVDDAPQFLLSDKPEYFRTGDGIAMQERVEPGVVRLYLYHVPEPSGARKTITAVIENLGDGPMTLSFQRYASPKPGGDYHKIAREAMVAFLAQTPAPAEFASRTVAPGRRVVIDPAIDSATVTRDVLVHVFHEFRIDQPARVTVFQREPSADSLEILDRLPKLPRVLPGFHASGAGRGLFARSEVSVTSESPYDPADGPKMLLLADGKTDPWIEGRDSIDPSSPIQNKGNYGVIYRVKLKYKPGRGVAVLMSGHRPDNKWCKYTSAVVDINDGHRPGGIIALPMRTPRFANLPEAVVMQTYAGKGVGETGAIEFTYSPPGACCLPTPILLVPLDR